MPPPPPSPYAHLPFRPCVGIVLLNHDDRIFVGERIDTQGAWQMPQGGIDEGEDIEEAARRELLEETGIDKVNILRVMEEPLSYTLPDHLIERLWNGRYQGQAQRWVIMRFVGEESDINLNFFNPPEFRAWEWAAPDTLLERIVPFKRVLYTKVLDFLMD